MASILLVEDTDVQATLLRNYVQKEHTIVGTVCGADDAVELARETNPDVVVMDLNLAEGNGIDATESIKSLDTTISVIVSTVYVSNEVKMRAVEAGADAYLFKPYSRQDLLETIEETIA
ncbi:response regulator [Halobellus marinus]|uniref:response regulator n=1 Tax=Halobellus TaxID=1073986 RepID=UPI0028A744FF|nr:response regulator [Halobellus sp. DFY28]